MQNCDLKPQYPRGVGQEPFTGIVHIRQEGAYPIDGFLTVVRTIQTLTLSPDMHIFPRITSRDQRWTPPSASHNPEEELTAREG
jgi:hypothetical protein